MSNIKKIREAEPTILLIAGPTASGKSHLALAMAELLGGEIVNADSMQVYRELSILTGRPSAKEQIRVPHHLYGTQSVAESGSAGKWLKAAVKAIDGILGRDRVPIVCGGSGLYLKVLCEGISPVPEVSEDYVSAANELYDSEGGLAFHSRLRRIDPQTANRLPHTDRQRLIRAYVVKESTGFSLEEWKASQVDKSRLGGKICKINISPPREALYDRIDRRLLSMIGAGALEEVASLNLGLNFNSPALKALGVREFRRYLDGYCSLEEAVEKVQRSTRNFAKRQITWFRNQFPANFILQDFGDHFENAMLLEQSADIPK